MPCYVPPSKKDWFQALLLASWVELQYGEPLNDKDEIFDGSYLNILWIGDNFKRNSIDRMIFNLKNLDYDKEAQNYEF